MYFVTICTYKHECIFGEIVTGNHDLSAGGLIAENCWLSIPDHFPKVILHDFVIMPNHVHGILELKEEIQMVPVVNVGAENLLPLHGQFESLSKNNRFHYIENRFHAYND
jgi:REP element-mobilizing transposase RayT